MKKQLWQSKELEISGMEGEETETKLLNSIYIFSWEKIIYAV